MFVRRGALRRFDRLKQDSEDLPVAVEWDRRLDERREASATVAEEGRRSERRSEPPFTWALADFVVVESPSDGAQQQKADAPNPPTPSEDLADS